MARSVFRVPRPKTFLHFFSLRTGTNFILLVHLINKATAIYGILALFTAHPLDNAQLSMYIYSLLALAVTLYLARPLKASPASPFHAMGFAYLYALDAVINALYTASFALAWFAHLAGEGDRVPGGKTIGGTAGFTNPKVNASAVDVIAKPRPGMQAGQEAVAIPSAAGTNPNTNASFGGAIFQSGSIMSLVIIYSLWALRVYALAVVFAYARMVLRLHVQISSSSTYTLYSGSQTSDLAENPFAEGREEGKGWKGRLGRAMVGCSATYWLGKSEDDMNWARDMGGKFRKSLEPGTGQGVGERERRRRSGTGPQTPPPNLPPLGGQ